MSIPSTPEGAVLRAARSARRLSIDTLVPSDRLLVVVPHPDDETLGCGMALAAAVAEGRQVAILLLTDGEASHPNSCEFTAERRIAMRSAELAAALMALAPDQPIPVLRARLPDGRTTDRHAAQVSNRLLEHDCIAGAGTIWSTWAHDPHCDHRSAAILARLFANRSQAALWSFVVWGRFGERPVPDEPGVFFDARFGTAKRAAMDAHASQMSNLIDDDPTGFRMPPALIEHFATHPEVFFDER